MRAFLLALFLGAISICQAADTVAVLPLFNRAETTASNLDWIGESVAETIRESLASSGLLALPREGREEVYKRLGVRTGVVLTKASVIRIGETLDAGMVVFGDFEITGDAAASTPQSPMRIALHVLDLKKLHELPVIEQSGPMQNLGEMEVRLAWMALRQLAPNSPVTETTFLHDRPPIRLDAKENYIRGLMAESADQRMKLFTQAARLDDHFSEPNFQIGRMLFSKKDYRGASQSLAKVAVSDSHYMEALFLLGICVYQQGDYDASVTDFRMVATQVPINEVFNNLGAALLRKGDLPGAEDAFRKALAGDEGDPDYWFNVGYALWKQNSFQQAADKFRAVLDRTRNDQDATLFLGRCLKQEGPRAGDTRGENRERLKPTFEDSAYRQLQAELRGAH